MELIFRQQKEREDSLNRKEVMMRKISLTLLFAIMVFSYSVYAQETELRLVALALSGGDNAMKHEYEFPEIKPEASITGGYRYVDVNGSERAGEYEYLQDSFTFGGELRLFSFPHRLHFDVDFKNKKDYFGDVTYSWKDKIYFRGINSTIFHNLSNISLIDFDTSTSSPGVSVRDAGEEYGIRTSLKRAFLRIKPLEFPFHIYLDGKRVDKYGTRQLRHMHGSGYFNDIVRASQKRDIDWQTKKFTIGTNSHLGPVEVDFSHVEKRFKDKGDKVLVDTYTPAGFFPPASVRIGGPFPHDIIPEIKSTTNTLKLHTTYTGKLVASATFSKTDRENEDSGADADYFIGAGNIIWVPTTKVSFYLKYKYRDIDVNNPETVTIANICSPSNNSLNNYACDIKPSISSITNTLSGTVRYRPVSKLTLRAKYAFKDIQRSNAEAWDIPESTQNNTVRLSADLRIMKGLKLKGDYTHKDINNPAYNTYPDRSHKGRISVSWIPFNRLNTLLSYTITDEERKDLHFLDEDGNVIAGAEDRDVTRQSFLGSITFLILDNLSITTSYAYMHNNVKQDIAYIAPPPGFGLGIPMIDSGVPYKNTARNYAVDISYIPGEHINLTAGVSHTKSSGKFSPADINLTQPVSVDSFSELKIRETIYSISGEYTFKKGFSSGIQYRYSDFDDAIDNPFDDVEDGEAHIMLVNLSKKW
jgi:predicted porin